MAWNLSSLLLAAALLRFEAVEPHMGTLFRITVYAGDAATARKGFDAAFRRVHELDEALSDYNPRSELMRVCRQAHAAPVKVSEDLFHVLEEAQRIAAASDGAFDVTLGPVIRLWRTARREGRMPPAEQLDAAMRLTGYRYLKLDAAARTVALAMPGMQLDLGGIAKGYAADQALRVLRGAGITQRSWRRAETLPSAMLPRAPRAGVSEPAARFSCCTTRRCPPRETPSSSSRSMASATRTSSIQRRAWGSLLAVPSRCKRRSASRLTPGQLR